MLIPEITCQSCERNAARYLNENGKWLCSLCDMTSISTSVRILDIPELLLCLRYNVLRPEAYPANIAVTWDSRIKELLWKRSQ